MQNKDAFAILLFVVQQIILLLGTSGILANIEFGTISFEFKVKNKKIVHSRPSIELEIQEASTK